jgi:hypothetical protein
VLLYGAESWRTTNAMLSKIQRFIKYCLRGDATWWLPQCVANPCPFPLFNLYVYGVLVCSLSKILISDFVETSDVHDFS